MRELTLPGRMILLPGFGCDGRVFGPQRRAFGDRLETPAWITPKPDESIRHYAQRWAEQLSRPGDDPPLALGGLSLGGVVAQEMVKFIEPTPRCLLLVATARKPERFSFAVQLSHLLGRFVPEASANKSAAIWALLFALRDGVDDDGKTLLRQMAKDIDPAVLTWAGRAALDWPGPEAAAPGDPPTYQVHGRNDWVIHPGPEVDLVLDKARHLINHSNAQTVNHFLFDKFLQHVPEAHAPTPRVEDPHKTIQRRLILEGAPAGTPLV